MRDRRMRGRTIVRVDATRFEKRIGDEVHTGEALGEWDGQTVCAPLDGYVENVSFCPENHSLVITLVRHETLSVEGQG